MRYLSVVFLMLVAMLAMAQDPKSSKPPEEMALISFLLGKWEGKEKMSFGEMKSEGTGGHHMQLALGGRFIESHYRGKSEAMGEMEGRLFLCFDETTKKFQSWWFDKAASGTLAMTGEVKGESLVMESKPVEMPGMGLQTFRAVFAKKGDQLTFELSMKQGNAWAPMIEATYSKK